MKCLPILSVMDDVDGFGGGGSTTNKQMSMPLTPELSCSDGKGQQYPQAEAIEIAWS